MDYDRYVRLVSLVAAVVFVLAASVTLARCVDARRGTAQQGEGGSFFEQKVALCVADLEAEGWGPARNVRAVCVDRVVHSDG